MQPAVVILPSHVSGRTLLLAKLQQRDAMEYNAWLEHDRDVLSALQPTTTFVLLACHLLGAAVWMSRHIVEGCSVCGSLLSFPVGASCCHITITRLWSHFGFGQIAATGFCQIEFMIRANRPYS